MVALVGGSSVGLSLTSLTTLAQRGVWGQAQQGRNGEAAYVNVVNGNAIVQDRDDQLVGRGLTFASVRTYNSEGSFPTHNQDHWLLGTQARSAKRSGGLNTVGSTITRTDQDGADSVYTYDAARGLYVSTAGGGAYDTVRYDLLSTNFVWTDGATGLSERYQSFGQGALLSTSDTSGNTIAYTYNLNGTLSTVTDASGEVSSFIYGSGQNVSEIRTQYSNGLGGVGTLTRAHYTYDSLNRLTKVSVDLSPEDNSIADAKVYTTTYTYDGTSARIASAVQSDGSSIQLSYVLIGADYRVASFTDGLGQITQFTYDTVNRKTTVTDPLGLVTTYEYDAGGRLTRVTAPPVAGVSQVNTFAYDAAGNVTQSVDALGNVLTMSYDASGNQTLQRDALGNTVTRTFGTAFNQLLTETVYAVADPDPDGAGAAQATVPQTTRYVYDSQDRLRFVISPEGRVNESRYAPTGERIATIEYDAAAYDVSTLSATAAPTELQMNLWALVQDKTRTQLVDMSYDLRGQLKLATTYASVNALGLGVADGSQSATTYLYDQAGQLLKTVTSQGGVSGYVYDGLGRVISTTDALNNSTVTQYDDAHNASSVRFANGLTTTSSYDKAGRLVSVLQSDAAAYNLGQTTYTYDADGRLLLTVDPTGVRHNMLYDAAGRKIADIDGNGTLTEYRYDADNRVTCSIEYATPINRALLQNAAGAPVNPALSVLGLTATARDRASWSVFDAAGRLVKTVDPVGAVVETRYDGVGRVTAVVQYASTINVGGLGNAPTASQVNPATSADDRVQREFYDNDGLLRGTLDAEGYLVEYRLDAGGRRTSSIAYANLRDYSLTQHGDNGYTNSYHYTLARFEGYKEASIAATSTLFEPGSTVDHYDANGHLAWVNDTTKGENNRSFVNDQAGTVLQVTQGVQVQRELVANGQVMARYGVGIDPLKPRDDDGNPRFVALGDFTPTFRSIDANYPSASVGSYTVAAGDTLQCPVRMSASLPQRAASRFVDQACSISICAPVFALVCRVDRAFGLLNL